MANEKEVVFKGRIIRNTFNGGDYKVYAIDVDKDIYPDIKFTKYGNAIISGELHDLGVGIEYTVKAIEQNTKYGYGYKVINITRDRPKSTMDMYYFLQEILTINQAETLYNVYPDIVERVMENRLDDIDLNKLKGIKEYTFEIIKDKIVENFCLSELVIEFQGLISLSILKKLYEKYTSIQMIRNKLKEDGYKCLCGLSRVGFITADSLLLELEKSNIVKFDSDLKTSKQRCLACIMYLLEENENNGHTRMNISELRNQVIKLCPACSNHFVECIKYKDIYYDKDSMVVALKLTYEIEKYIAEQVLYSLVSSKNNKWDYDIEKYRSVGGFNITDEQIKSLENLCKYNISILNGAGGTGKTNSTKAIINMLKDKCKTFRLFSPTGKAAKILSEYTKESASTIHRGLGYMPPNDWGYNEDNKLNVDVIIIDEFSMVDIFLFQKILKAVDLSRTKLILVGDNAQLPSVACGNLLHDFMQSEIIPTTTLTKVFRYGEGGLMKIATDVRMCKSYLNDITNQLTYFGDNKDYAFINVDQQYIVKNVVALYEKLLSQGHTIEDIQVLTAYKKGEYGSIAINNQLQKIANKNYSSSEFMKIGETVYFKGDLIIQVVNNYHAEVYIADEWCDEKQETFIANGETGVIKEINTNYALIDFDGVMVKYYRNDMQMINLGYSISIHKSQGSSLKVVILLTPQAHTYMLNSNIIYVGLTRMKEKCFHLGNVNTVNTSVKKKANLTRNTFMQEILKNYLKMAKVS